MYTLHFFRKAALKLPLKLKVDLSVSFSLFWFQLLFVFVLNVNEKCQSFIVGILVYSQPAKVAFSLLEIIAIVFHALMHDLHGSRGVEYPLTNGRL